MMMRKNCSVEIIRLTSSVLCQNELEEDLYSSEIHFLSFFFDRHFHRFKSDQRKYAKLSASQFEKQTCHLEQCVERRNYSHFLHLFYEKCVN